MEENKRVGEFSEERKRRDTVIKFQRSSSFWGNRRPDRPLRESLVYEFQPMGATERWTTDVIPDPAVCFVLWVEYGNVVHGTGTGFAA